MGTKQNHSRLPPFHTVILRTFVKLKLITIGYVFLDYIIKSGRIVPTGKRQGIFVIVLFQLIRGIHIPVVYLHNHEDIHLVQFLTGIQIAT